MFPNLYSVLSFSGTKRVLTPEELAEFYTDFLEQNRETFKVYNREWYKRNISMLLPAACAAIVRLFKGFQRQSWRLIRSWPLDMDGWWNAKPYLRNSKADGAVRIFEDMNAGKYLSQVPHHKMLRKLDRLLCEWKDV